MTAWTHPNPVFLDFETQSACDIKARGGRLYALDPTTRILSLVADIDGVYHVWFPTLEGNIPPAALADARVESYGVAPRNVVLHSGPRLPEAIADAAARRPLVAHNAFGFDRFIWDRFIGIPAQWADTLYLARSVGLPGSLDALAKAQEIGQKDAAKLIAMKLTKATWKDGSILYPPLLPGMVAPLLRYNLVDVVLLRRVWDSLADAGVEVDVIESHVRVNDRGIRVDESLLAKLSSVSAASVGKAAGEMSRLSDGALNANTMRSVPKTREWLATKGVRIADYNGKETLRKDVVAQCLANPELMVDPDSPVACTADSIDPAVFNVLRLRAAAMRITGAKAERATARVSRDGRVRDLFSYHQAHTGRWSSSGVQVHNLPRPKKGVDVERLLSLHESGDWSADGDQDEAYAVVATCINGKLTVDDALAALIRPSFLSREGHSLLVLDFAAIECRGIAWLAGEDGLLDTFRVGEDVYLDFGARLFGRPITKADATERQVAKVCVLGCGYSLGPEKFGLYCALQGVDLRAAGVTAEQCVDAFRSAYPAIAGSYAGCINGRPYRKGGVWDRLARAAMSAVAEGTPTEVGGTRWAYDGTNLVCTLPSGRPMVYRDARVEDCVPAYVRALGLPEKPRATVVYSHPQGYRKQLYGGLLSENVTQALCRDLLADALVRAEAAGLPVVAHVHDELVCEVPSETAGDSLQQLAQIMSTPPAWAAGFPVDVEGYAAPRYLKAAPKGYPTVHARNGVVL